MNMGNQFNLRILRNQKTPSKIDNGDDKDGSI